MKCKNCGQIEENHPYIIKIIEKPFYREITCKQFIPNHSPSDSVERSPEIESEKSKVVTNLDEDKDPDTSKLVDDTLVLDENSGSDTPLSDKKIKEFISDNYTGDFVYPEKDVAEAVRKLKDKFCVDREHRVVFDLAKDFWNANQTEILHHEKNTRFRKGDVLS